MHHRLDHLLEPIYLLYDERMLLHRPVGWEPPEVFPEYLDECDEDYPMENPERLRVVYQRLCNLGRRLLRLHHNNDMIFHPLTCEMATKEQVLLAHSRSLYERLEQLQYYSDSELKDLSHKYQQDLYYSRETFQAARLAAGGLLACVDAVCNNTHNNTNSTTTAVTNKSIALVRPPGHHACQSQEMGFCFLDSVVIAAKYALQHHHKKVQRVAILDWDIHDGNGTSEGTIDDDRILRIDLHRYNPKDGFYPYTGPPHEVGSGKARGLNLNLAWSQGGMRNHEYAAAFYELLLPILVDYQPDLLLISCGLDAAMGDLLGGCELTPGFFHAMTRATLEAIGPDTPVVCALEGGYAMKVLPDCMEAVTLAMLNCPFAYHSSSGSTLVGGGAAPISTTLSTTPNHKQDRLERSRQALSNYYMRGRCRLLLYTAVQDINCSIRIFQNLARWKHLELQRLVGPPPPNQPMLLSASRGGGAASPKKRTSTTPSSYVCSEDLTWMARPFQRPRIYLWYGTECHHKQIW